MGIEALSEFPAQRLEPVNARGNPLPAPNPPSNLGELPAVLMDALTESIQTGVSTVSAYLYTAPSAMPIYARRVQGTAQTYDPQFRRERGLNVGHILDTLKEKGPLGAIKDTLNEMDGVLQLATIFAGLYLASKVIRLG